MPPNDNIPNAYLLRIELIDSQPLIWRTLQVPSDFVFADLHNAIQLAMGWENSHLHQFVLPDRTFVADPRLLEDPNVEDEKKIGIASRISGGQIRSFIYEYDFGDGWMHRISVLEDIHEPSDSTTPRVLDGQGGCPPEDSGGIYGYQQMLEILKDPKHPEYGTYSDWIPKNFEPEAFDAKEKNVALTSFFLQQSQK